MISFPSSPTPAGIKMIANYTLVSAVHDVVVIDFLTGHFGILSTINFFTRKSGELPTINEAVQSLNFQLVPDRNSTYHWKAN